MRTSRSFQHPELDSLRFFAFVLVFVHHAAPQDAERYARGGLPVWAASWIASFVWSAGFGVDLFFVLSAYLITELLLRERDLTGDFSVGRFYARRALRIWPLYFSFVGFVAVVLFRILPGERLAPTYLVGFVFFVGNWVIAFLGWPTSVASPLWSLSIEEQFYGLWPLALKRLHGRAIPVAAVAMMVAALAWRIAVRLRWDNPLMIGMMTPAKVDTIGAGILVAYILRGDAPRLSSVTRVALAAAALFTLSLLGLDRGNWLHAVVTLPLATAASVALVVAVLHPAGSCPRWLRLRPVTFLGRISFGLYVFHSLALRVPYLVGVHSLAIGCPVALVLTIAWATVSYFLLERPFLRLKERFATIRRGRDAPVGAVPVADRGAVPE